MKIFEAVNFTMRTAFEMRFKYKALFLLLLHRLEFIVFTFDCTKCFLFILILHVAIVWLLSSI